MKRKILAICAAVIFGVLGAGAFAACNDAKKPEPTPHVCGHACTEDGCGKCLDTTCTDPACAEKCEGHTPVVAEHECNDECPDCGKCTSDCTDPACAEKCEGHTPIREPHVCEYVCAEDGCGKCLDSDCEEPECAEKCEGHAPIREPHVCEHTCTEDGCGKCIDTDCEEPECAEKCPGHNLVTFDLDGGEGTVAAAKYTTGETFALPTADGFTKGVCTLAGWNDGTDDYEPGAQYEMPNGEVTFTAVWKAGEFTFAVVTGGVQNANVILKPGTSKFDLNDDHIGGVAANKNAAMVFDVNADKAGKALLYFTVCDRQGEFTFDDAYSLTVNGTVVPSSTDMSKGGTDWDRFESYMIAELDLSEGKNRIVITVLDTGDLDIAGNVKGITLTSETVACTPYVEPDWTVETTFDALDGGALRSGVRSCGTPSGGENCIGAMQWEGNFVAFRVVSDNACSAAAYINVCHRPSAHGLCDAFELYVDGKPVTCYSPMPTGGAEWTAYDYVKLGIIDLPAGRPIEITIVSKGGDGSAYNVRGLKLVTETEQNISLTTDGLYGYATDWNVADIPFVTVTDGTKAVTPGVTTGGGVSIDGACAALGNIGGNKGATVSFTVTATEATRAVLSIGFSFRDVYYFNKAYELKVNGKTVFSCAAMPQGSSWVTSEDVALAEVMLESGDNVITLTVITSEGWMGSNLFDAKIQYENGSVTLKP